MLHLALLWFSGHGHTPLPFVLVTHNPHPCLLLAKTCILCQALVTRALLCHEPSFLMISPLFYYIFSYKFRPRMEMHGNAQCVSSLSVGHIDEALA